MVQQHGLGRGLSSLIPPKKNSPQESPFKDMVLKSMAAQGVDIGGGSSAEAPTLSVSGNGIPLEIPIHSIVPNPHQPRLRFDEGKLQELADSIKEHGILQPLVLSIIPEGKYELIAGERRLQAAKKAGLATVPAVIREAREQDKLELAIIENIQRHDLNPIEEAKAYARLSTEFGLTQEEIAKKMGKSRSVVANAMRLLSLPIEVQRSLSEGVITEGHAKALLSMENPEKQRALFDLIVRTGMTVREAEAKSKDASVRTRIRHTASISPELAEKADRLASVLGTKVAVKPAGNGGRIIVEYYSNEEFDQILSKLTD